MPVSLGPLLDSVIAFYGPLAAEQGLSLRRRGDSDATVSGDISWLRQLFGNLVENACRHTPSGGWIDLETERAKQTVLVRVRDTGSTFSVSLPSISDSGTRHGGRARNPSARVRG